MPFDVQALLHKKKALIGVGVAGAAGLYVLARRKQATGSSLSQPTTAAGGGAATGTGFPNTTGTDVASWLGTQSGQLAAQNADFLDQLKQTLGTGGILPQQGPVYIPEQGIGDVNKWISSVNAANPGLNLTFQQLQNLNPGVVFGWSNQNGFLPPGTPTTGATPTFGGGLYTLRVK